MSTNQRDSQEDDDENNENEEENDFLEPPTRRIRLANYGENPSAFETFSDLGQVQDIDLSNLERDRDTSISTNSSLETVSTSTTNNRVVPSYSQEQVDLDWNSNSQTQSSDNLIRSSVDAINFNPENAEEVIINLYENIQNISHDLSPSLSDMLERHTRRRNAIVSLSDSPNIFLDSDSDNDVIPASPEPEDNENQNNSDESVDFLDDNANNEEDVRDSNENSNQAQPAQAAAEIDQNTDSTTASTSTQPINSQKCVCVVNNGEKSIIVNEEDEGFLCQICFEPYTNSGEHRVGCLKCGHIYGKQCIERWIKSAGKCPQCCSKASKKDFRLLFVKNIVPIDTAERDRALAELEKERESRRRIELENSTLKLKVSMQESELYKIQKEFTKFRNGGGHRSEFLDEAPTPGPSTNSHHNNFNFTLFNKVVFRDSGECRVGAYSEYLSMLTISDSFKGPLYPNGCFGIRKVNLLDMRVTQTTGLHQKQIRDLTFSPSRDNLLLSVGLDKKAVLHNTIGNVTVQTYTTDSPLWSACWNQLNDNIFYVGTSTGQMLTYDLRKPGSIVESLLISPDERSAVSRLIFITPNRGSGSKFVRSGILVQKIQSCWFYEVTSSGYKLHQLPLEGPFLSVGYEHISSHFLTSTRATKKMGSYSSSHIVAELVDSPDHNICTCNVLQSIQSKHSGNATMTRPGIFSSNGQQIYVGANTEPNCVKIWSANDVSKYQSIKLDTVMDFVPVKVNDKSLISLIGTNWFNLYSYDNSTN